MEQLPNEDSPMYVVAMKAEPIHVSGVVYCGEIVSPLFFDKSLAMRWQMETGRRNDYRIVEI